MIVLPHRLPACAAMLALAAGASLAWALPEKVDPAKISAAAGGQVLRPEAAPAQVSPFASARIIRIDEARTRTAAVQGDRAAVEVREARAKRTVQGEVRTFAALDGQRRRKAGEMTANVPRIDAERFRRMLRDYEQGRIPADTLLNDDIELGGRRVSVGDINKFANPRRALEEQGIPVFQAGSGRGGEAGAEPAESSTRRAVKPQASSSP